MPGFAEMGGVAVGADGKADPQTQLFRSNAIGVETGPMISQVNLRFRCAITGFRRTCPSAGPVFLPGWSGYMWFPVGWVLILKRKSTAVSDRSYRWCTGSGAVGRRRYIITCFVPSLWAGWTGALARFDVE